MANAQGKTNVIVSVVDWSPSASAVTVAAPTPLERTVAVPLPVAGSIATTGGSGRLFSEESVTEGNLSPGAPLAATTSSAVSSPKP